MSINQSFTTTQNAFFGHRKFLLEIFTKKLNIGSPIRTNCQYLYMIKSK